jgi:hypothetical protein
MVLEHEFDVGTARGLDLRDCETRAIAVDSAIVRAGASHRENDAEFEFEVLAGVLAVDSEHLVNWSRVTPPVPAGPTSCAKADRPEKAWANAPTSAARARKPFGADCEPSARFKFDCVSIWFSSSFLNWSIRKMWLTGRAWRLVNGKHDG